MRIEFITQDDPLYILPLFQEFLPLCDGKFEVTQISSCPTMGSRPRTQLMRELFALYGPWGMTKLIGKVASSRILGRLPASRTSSTFHSMAQLCRTHEIPYVRIGNPNATSFVEGLSQRKPDLIVSVACPYILKRTLLSVPPLGCINSHHAPLPRYKGMMPTFWQMYHGERSVGLTIHYMSEGLDEGPIILQEQLAVDAGEALDHLIRRSKRHAAGALNRVLGQFLAGEVRTSMPVKSEGSYYTFPTLAEIRDFHRRGLRAI